MLVTKEEIIEGLKSMGLLELYLLQGSIINEVNRRQNYVRANKIIKQVLSHD